MLLTYASRRGQALLDRALYLPRDWAADDERRELTGVPDELAFATKPQLAAAMLERAREAGMPARWVAADEVYGGRDLRTRIRELGYDYAIAVPASHRVTTPAGRFTVTSLLDRLPRRAWQRVRAGHGAKGDRHYDWAMIETGPDDTPPGHSVLLIRRHRYTGELSFSAGHSPPRTPPRPGAHPALVMLAPPSPAPRGDLPPPLERDHRSRHPMSANDKDHEGTG